MPIYYKRPSLIQGRDTWTTGSGSTGIYTQNGATAENERVNGTDPFGNTSVLWECRSEGDNNADGGWDTSAITLDNTKLHRFSVWMRRTSSASSGTVYFGAGYGDAWLTKIVDGATEGNPYWVCNNIGDFTQNTWYLLIGHIFPYNYVSTVNHPNTGIWTVANNRINQVNFCNIGGDLRFSNSSSYTTTHRAYLYYSTNASDRIQFYNPMVECCDGSEGTVESLLSNTADNISSTTTITKEGAARKREKAVVTGGNQIKDVGQWRIHVFTGTSSLVVSSYLGSGLKVEYMIVAGGGGTGYDVGGGGGGGGMLTGYCYLSGTTYTVTVGGGGASGGGSGVQGTNGSDSTFNGLTATGGGGGGAYNSNTSGKNGGCGGGGGNPSGAAGTGSQGFNGGTGSSGSYGGAGGGGTGSAGANGIDNTVVLGGLGRLCGIWGRPYKYAGGGYGNSDGGYIAPTGVSSGGTYLGYYGYGANGTGSPNASTFSGNGGIVIIRYKYI